MTKAASLPSPPRRGELPLPPSPIEARGNIQKAPTVQLNVRMDPDSHEEIKIAAIKERMTLGDYLWHVHVRYQGQKKEK